MLNRNLLLISVIIFCFISVSAQDNVPSLKDNSLKKIESFQVGEIGGNINRTAILLPKPIYPNEAKFAGSDGAVKVEITIDENGAVNSAKAVSGDSLLHSAAEEAARKTRFTNRTTDGKPVKMNGILVYNFIIEKAGWLKIGYDLTVIQKAPTLSFVNFTAIRKAFSTDWTSEIESLDRLVEMRRLEPKNQGGVPGRNVPVLTSTSNTLRSTVTAQIQIPIPNPPTPERISIAQNLLMALQNRVTGNAADSWRLNLGSKIVEAMEYNRDPANRKIAAEMLRPFAENAPMEIAPESLNALKNIITIFKKGSRTIESENDIAQSLAILFTDK